MLRKLSNYVIEFIHDKTSLFEVSIFGGNEVLSKENFVCNVNHFPVGLANENK